jgi:OmpA-OmpF porin, OOP family
MIVRRATVTCLIGAVLSWGHAAGAADWGGVLGGIAQKAKDAAAAAAQSRQSSSSQPAVPSEGGAAPTADTKSAGSADAGGQPTYKTYQNYDFVPGDKIIFDDDFRADMDGEFPAHWHLVSGQGVVNMLQGAPAFALTQGNYVKVEPRVSTKSYLGDSFTVEFDFYAKSGGNDLLVFLETGGDEEEHVSFGPEVGTGYFKDVHDESAKYPGNRDTFEDHWHHGALVFKNGQMKCYVDQYRVLVMPEVGSLKPQRIAFGGIGRAENPLLFKNVRIASGGGMNLIDRLTKEGRVVTHGILFDVNKADVRPESMGTIRQIAAALDANPSLRLEIDGHTDSDGDAAQNLSLSQARAEAVKTLLVQQGIDASRLSTKGYGATKPIDSNSTPEGKANNRRVELIKL